MPVRLDGYTDLPAGKIANVVTFLERTTPPSGDPVPPPGLTLAHVAKPLTGPYRALFRRIGEDWLWTSLVVMSDKAVEERLRDPLIEVHVLERDGEPIGLAELDRRRSGEVEIVYFGVVPEATGTGAARYLMDETLRRAFTPGVGRVWLHTCTFDHPAAVRFYLGRGFTAFKYAIEVMDDPRLTGHLPKTAAPHIPLIETK